MADEDRPNQSEQDRQNEYMRGGKGRKDEVGRSGIYPASAPTAPADAEVRGQGDFVHHKGARQTPADEPGVTKSDQSSGSQ